jgi:hypothetical protein
VSIEAEVGQIVQHATADRDAALDSPGATVRSLRPAWDPPHLPGAVGEDRDQFDDQPSDWELEQEQLADHEDRRRYLALRSCAKCGKPSRRLVRRWQAGRTAIAADDDDPARDQAGYVEGLSEPPAYTLQPSWAVCGTACARKVIEEDQAAPKGSRLAGRTEFFYEIEPFRYLPHDSVLPRVLVRLRGSADLIGYSRDQLDRAVAARDAAGAAVHLASLRRDIARTAAILAELTTWTPAGRTFRPGDPHPADVGQVRHADIIYSDMRFLYSNGREDHWEAPDGTRHKWDELTEMAGGSLTEIPRERIHVPGRDDDDDPDD